MDSFDYHNKLIQKVHILLKNERYWTKTLQTMALDGLNLDPLFTPEGQADGVSQLEITIFCDIIKYTLLFCVYNFHYCKSGSFHC